MSDGQHGGEMVSTVASHKVYTAFHPMIAGIGSSSLHDPDKNKRKRMDGWIL